MIADKDLKPISPKAPAASSSAEHVFSGIPIPKTLRVTIFSPAEWESFVEEWASSLDGSYTKVRRFGGAGDQGIDVVGFVNDTGWEGGWDNYQCKRYDHPLRPSDVWVELGKIIYYSYLKEYPAPRKYYFVASQGISTSLEKLLANPEKLKEDAKSKWDEHCKDKITSTASISLDGGLLDWFDAFDFSVFSSKSVAELVAEHSQTPYHAVRFGGGLPPRPAVPAPPDEHDERESRYIQQIYNAYGHHLGVCIKEVSDLASCSKPKLKDDFLRQRERFYHAESLRNFARDTVPTGTFESLQDEIFHGVIEVCDKHHEDGLVRMQATLAHAGVISTAANPLQSVIRIQDRQGMCHQLANEARLIWVPEGEEVRDDGAI